MAEQTQDMDYPVGEPTGNGDHYAEDPELAAIKARVMEMEEEADRLREQQHCEAVERQLLCNNTTQAGLFYTMTHEERMDADNRSVYVGNVDYGATADELEIHFNGCGPVNRVTILCDRFSGHPKGFAYIEFSDRDSVQTAIGLDETMFRGRVIKVLPKRTNMPGISSTDRGGQRGNRPRGRGFRPPRYIGGFQGRFRYPPTRPVVPHPYYGPPGAKRHWGPPEYREQAPKRHPCLLLITPPTEAPGPSGHLYPQQR
ncbi:embryonic polyadenylate-binding protein 2 [Osmerus eperlanus]|uniref:embryonic polyadenylate-binding protein 2 n=1 Tax=Osmerus eperlanus TaxID=29151 RepID=UPI002E13CD84